MRASTAYFVGAGTIVAAIAIGLGGGIVAGNIMNPIAPKQGPDTTRISRRAEAAAPVASNAPSERLQYLRGSQVFGAVAAAPAQAQDEAKPDAGTTQANAAPAPQTAAVEPPKESPKPAPLASEATKPAEQQASTEPASSPDNAYAKARDADLKRAASERRRAERHERWAERRRYDPRDARGMRDQTDWNDVARNVREDSDAGIAVNRPRSSFPQIRLFDSDDDD